MKILKIFVTILSLLTIAIVPKFAHNGTDLYAKSACVVSVNYMNDVVTIKDSQGFLWEFCGCEDWEVNDNCACIMDTCGTSEIFDDVIVSVNYQG